MKTILQIYLSHSSDTDMSYAEIIFSIFRRFVLSSE